ncbi:sugar transferase [Sphingobium lignivorans]|uniref:Lipopolysaccharide/colanic/teichoic acid biosynthesis glycosyltransferase n=1 Tax=Sphingobium lignivorans TaxID=2735886 RepID=A0ABR6NFR4_9SPHN|nr:sugar transferase [Sphingobium lignivorans]MBB5986128.1 lipopolysaccharide/colanic/teichoic acid biosynthesis glycosyltransferase [Sphingobium lignivorans]
MDYDRWTGMAGRVLCSNRFVLGVAILAGVALPAFLRAQLAPMGAVGPTASGYADVSVIASSTAIVGAHLSVRQLGVLPLVATRHLLVPVFLATFGLIFLALMAARIPMDDYFFWMSCAISLTWYGGVFALRHRLVRPTIALLGSAVHPFDSHRANFEWQPVEQPVISRPVTAMVVDPHEARDVESAQLIAQLVLAGIPVYHRSHFEECLTGRVRFTSHADNNFGALLPSLTYLRVKRLLDFVVAVAALPLVIPVILVAGLIVKLDSPGPMLFCQPRVGYRGRQFICFKLRTMRCGQDGPAFTLQEDPRLTRTGQLLRKWRIDELPQIINVLKGEMSWIGPRPEAVSLAERYGQHLPYYDYRHAVRPGISGWAAVHQGNVGDVEAAREKLEYDFYYIKYFSFWLDFLISIKTIGTIFSGFGSR